MLRRAALDRWGETMPENMQLTDHSTAVKDSAMNQAEILLRGERGPSCHQYLNYEHASPRLAETRTLTHRRVIKEKACDTYDGPRSRRYGANVLPPKPSCIQSVQKPRNSTSDGDCMA